ncbi:flavin-containing monooxygenase [Falsiroseomonas selenitidurans]|uniref:NAD(P)/FAD-dependent oxidoreductase n=1 Tax=Falsiroseomonas selenitidurans TaxID=2716335 RepID=A0ABX1EBZ0_9PROT|nr:NAD(P)/FAD-dependent oxidoreductase [Falsiroseomonas selenitidurans]NKC34363.1 NAD(P)/FAD-dependent oxidoreductase [Falsiroseomonas selenitidurans]
MPDSAFTPPERTAPGLAALEARLRQDLAWLEWPAKPWVPPRRQDGQDVTDVVIIGAGMCGLAAAAALRLLGIANIRVLDRAPAGQEGPWVTFARMETLRSPKTLAGPALDLPALTFRAWYEYQHGAAAFDALGKIPRALWMDYLIWYRRVMDIPVENAVAVEGIRPLGADLFTLETTAGRILARRVVLATGRDGLGGPWLPEIAEALPPALRAHSRDAIDFAALAGKRVGVVGAGASAMDNAAAALEAGCARLDMIVRRPALPRVNKFTGIGSPGVVHGFAGLPDAWKWRFLDLVLGAQTPPPRDSTLRVARFPHAHLHLASPIRALSAQDGVIRLETPHRTLELDFLIFGTGFRVDIAGRPELAALAPHIRLWGDRFQAERLNEELATSPDLDPGFAFQERQPGTCPALARLHCFNYPATLSHGKLSGDIPAVSAGARRLAHFIARAFFVEDREAHFASLQAYETPELLGDEWPDRATGDAA